MDLEQLNKIAVKMSTRGQGLLAADESTGTIKKRFDNINLPNTEDNRRDWREMLFRTDDAMQNYISGVILYDETLRQKAKDGTPLVDLLIKNDAIPGIKVDMGAKVLAASPKEWITEGLDGLREKLAEYYALGARFAKWRAVIEISDARTPSQGAVKANTHALARYAALCQEANIVPIVEPELLMGGDHSIERAQEVTEHVLYSLYADLHEQRVPLEGTILKPNMVVPGKRHPRQCSTDEIAERTLKVLKNCVPISVPGVAFLSGGQDNIAATENLNTMNKIGGFPWALTYSYGRALQADAIKAWNGKNYDAGQAAFAKRAKMNSLAAKGEWSWDIERSA